MKTDESLKTGDMSTAAGLRKELADTYAALKRGDIKRADADAMANLCGKIIGSAKAQIDYYTLRKEAPVILFLQDDAQSPLAGVISGTRR